MDTLYHEILLDLYKHPLHKTKPAHFDVHHKEHNPLCGDVVELFVAFDGNKITDIGWQGDGCAISQASTSLLTDAVKGKTKKQAATITKETVLENLGLTNLNPTRLRCALLCLEALKKTIA